MNNDFEIIDCHIHPAPSAETYSCWYMPYRSAEKDVADLKACGITRACGSPIHRPKDGRFLHIEELNTAAIEFHRRFPDFYIPAVQTHTHFPDESCREIERLHREHGVKWIGELVGYMHGYGEDFATKQAFQIYELAAQLGMVVNIHCQDLNKIAKACEAFPKLSFVLAHLGNDQKTYLERLAVVAAHPNLHFDISGSGIHRWGSLEHGVRTAGNHKFLFGSDFPINTPASYVACVMHEHLTDDDRRAIFSENFNRLTGLQG